ncbi:MAG TPA: NAD-dependent epimerase/dehydratase family protein [Gemmatimonadaceae bacterium]
MNRVLITGASGFVGSRAGALFARNFDEVVGTVRSHARVARVPSGVKPVVTGELSGTTSWIQALRDVTHVVHIAARVHQSGAAARAAGAFQSQNVAATAALARQAREAGVRRFVFMSSIAVNGAEREKPYTSTDPPAPITEYGRSKLEAELQLMDIAGAAMEVVIVRAPIVYGPRAPGNFARLITLARLSRFVPLPLGGIENRRSVLFVGNLASALLTCTLSNGLNPAVVFPSDAEVVSTTEIVTRVAAQLGFRPLLVPVSPRLLSRVASAVGVGPIAAHLTESLMVDTSELTRLTGWRPRYSFDEGLSETLGRETLDQRV